MVEGEGWLIPDMPLSEAGLGNASFPREPREKVSSSILERLVSAQQTRAPALMLNLTYQMALKSHSFRFSYADKVSEG